MVSSDDFGRFHGSSDYHDWLEQQRPVVFLLLLRLLRNSTLPLGCDPWQQAEDLTQEVMIRLLLHPLDEGIVKPSAYVSRVAANFFYDFLRRANRERGLQHEVPWPRDSDEGERDDDWISTHAAQHQPGADFEILDEEVVGEIWDEIGAALDTTAEPEQNLQIVLLAVMGYSYAEIANRLGISEDRVRNVISRMRLKLASWHPEWSEGRRLRGPKRRPRRGGDDGSPEDNADDPEDEAEDGPEDGAEEEGEQGED